MRRPLLSSLLAVLFSALWPGNPVSAGLIFTTGSTLIISDDYTLITTIPGGGPTVTDTPDGMTLTGDIVLDNPFDPGNIVGVDLLVYREFTVGPLPMLADTELAVDLKFVNGGGSTTHPETTVRGSLNIFELGEGVLPPLVCADELLDGQWHWVH